MPVNKVVYGNTTVIDLTDSTLSSADQLANGVTAYDRSGTKITGTASGGGSTPYVLVTGEQDAGGGKIVHITGAVNQTISADAGGGDVDALSATVLLDLSDDTVDAAHLISGYTAHNSMGQPITGTAAPGSAVLGTKTISANGTYNASTDSMDGYSSVTVNVPTGTTPTGTKSISISSNGTTTEDVAAYANAEITVNVPNSYAASDEGKVVSSGALVSQTSDSVTSNGTVDTTTVSSLTVNVPTGTARTSADLTASGATVTVPAGLYAEAASKSVASGSATTPATTITANPTIAMNTPGVITATVSATQSVSPTVSSGYVSSGTAGTITVSGTKSIQLTTKGTTYYHPSTSDQIIDLGIYTTGVQTFRAVTHNLSAGDIKSGVTVKIGDSTDDDCVASVTGTYSGGSSKNIQAYIGYASRTANSYGATSVTLTVAKTGTYTISWCAWRGSSSGTMGTNLHIGSEAEAANHQTWTGTYGQCITLTDQSLTQGTVLTLYATSGNNSRTVYVGNLIIEEQ